MGVALVVIYLIVRLVNDMMQYTPSETRLSALVADGQLPEIPLQSDPSMRIRIDLRQLVGHDVLVGKEYGRPEDEWWNIEDVQVGSETLPPGKMKA